MAVNKEQWYLYTLESDGIHMVRAEHTRHHYLARVAAGKKRARYVGGFLAPMTDKELKRVAAHHNVPEKIHQDPALLPYSPDDPAR
jgi:hypothetical protein